MTSGHELPRRGEDSPDDLLAQANRLRGQLEYSEALAMARAAVTAHQASGGSGARLAEAQLVLGQLEEDLGHPDAAEAAYTAAAAAAELAPAPISHSVRVRALTKLASVLRDRGALEEADAALAEALGIADTRLPNGLEHAEVVAEQSRQLIQHGAYEEAERLASKAVTMAEGAPSSVAREETRTTALSALGTALRVSGRYGEAHAVLQSALASAEAAFGPRSLEAASALNDLGVCDKFSGRFDEGIGHYQESLAVFEEAVGLENPSVASLYHNLGGILHARRDFDAAEPWARQSVELRARLLGPDHVTVAADRAALASILMELGRYDEAEDLLRDALSCLEPTLGRENHDVVANYGNLAVIARRRGDLEEAERLYRQALEIKERLFGPEHPEVGITLNNLAVVCRRRGRLDEAEALYRRAIDVLSRTVEPAHPALAASRDNLNRMLNDRKPGEPDALDNLPHGAPEPG
jgi:tetratricopeptide (TPR) repeat protein